MSTNSQASTRYGDRVIDLQVGPCRLLLLKTSVQSVVSWEGSFIAHPNFGSDEELLLRMTTALLDKGTQHRDRFVLADVLENKGAHLSFSAHGPFVEFSGQALRDDVPDVVAVMAEQLQAPRLEADEFEKTRARMMAGFQRALDDTGIQAGGALRRELYPEAHPNYSTSTPASIKSLESLEPESVRTFHNSHFGSNELILVFVGDLDVDQIVQAVQLHFGGWEPHLAQASYASGLKMQPPSTLEIPFPDKANVDVLFGHGLSMMRQDDLFVPLYLANHILGGNFSARLMATVRDELGLTYGIRSGLAGIRTWHPGHWQIKVTLSHDRLQEGVDATLEVVNTYITEGPSDTELENHKTTVSGSFQVGLATTEGLAGALHHNAQRGFPTSYLDTYVPEVQAVTLLQVREAINKHFNPEGLHQVRAGVLPSGSQHRGG